MSHNTSGKIENKMDSMKKEAMGEFREAQSTLQHKREVFNKRIVEPVLSYTSKQANDKPLLTGLIGVFFALAFVPVITFLAFAAGCIAIVGGTALTISLTILGAVIGTAALFLGGALFVAAVTAATVTFWTFLAYATYRLVLHLTHASDLPTALKEMREEMRNVVFGKGTEEGKTSLSHEKHNIKEGHKA